MKAQEWSSARKSKRRKDKFRKPTEARRGSSSALDGPNSIPDEAVESIADFFSGLGVQLEAAAGGTGQTYELDNIGDIREIEDVGALARDLIRRIQSLRGQFRPGSLAARALPDVRFDENAIQAENNSQAAEQQETETSGDES